MRSELFKGASPIDVREKRVQVRRNSSHKHPRQVQEAEQRERKPAWPEQSGQVGDAKREGHSRGQGSTLGLQALARGPWKVEAGLRFRLGPPAHSIYSSVSTVLCRPSHPTPPLPSVCPSPWPPWMLGDMMKPSVDPG